MEMILLARLLILLSHWLFISAKKFTISSWNMSHHNGHHQNTAAMEDYEKFLDTFVSGNPVLSAIVAPFSKGLKDSKWCYPLYGCFQVGGPFISIYHPISLPPCPPHLIDVKMELYTRRNNETPFVFDPNDVSEIMPSQFNINSDNKFVVGGFLSGDGAIFKLGTIANLLAHSDFNVFNVNFVKASWGTYEQAVANARMVGVMTGHFVELLQNETRYRFSKIHLIGHSLGSHICGYAGERLSGKVGRITGLDPAGPYFERSDRRVRLDTTDAAFVDIIHTNQGFVLTGGTTLATRVIQKPNGAYLLDNPRTFNKCILMKFYDVNQALGIMQKIGHIDFYPNGGSQQPGCSLFDIIQPAASMTDVVGHVKAKSSHRRAAFLFSESINNSTDGKCRFISYSCSDYASFKWGKCRKCGENDENCAEMGFNADKYAAAGHRLPAPGKFYLTTNRDPPYCNI